MNILNFISLLRIDLTLLYVPTRSDASWKDVLEVIVITLWYFLGYKIGIYIGMHIGTKFEKVGAFVGGAIGIVMGIILFNILNIS